MVIRKEREWLKREFGEKCFENLFEELKERRKINILRFIERQNKKKPFKTKPIPKRNYLNSHPYWGQP